MAKYTDDDYVTKLLPESLARIIINKDMKLSKYMRFLHDLWVDSNEIIVEQRSEKEFLLSVMAQIDYLCNEEEYMRDLEEINKNAITEAGRLQIEKPNMGFYNNYCVSLLYTSIRNITEITVRDLFESAGYSHRVMYALWLVDMVCKNFGIRITQYGKPVDLKTAKLDSIVNIRRVPFYYVQYLESQRNK